MAEPPEPVSSAGQPPTESSSVTESPSATLRVFVDADVLFAGAASPSEHPSGSASLVVLRLAELTLLDAVTSEQAVTECERNLRAKLPEPLAERALAAFRHLVARALRVVPDLEPGLLAEHEGRAHPKDLPLLVTALRERCPLLTTFNTKDYEPGDAAVGVLQPGALVRRVRGLLAQLPSSP